MEGQRKSNFDTRSIHIQILSIQYGWMGGYPASTPLLIGPCSMPPWQQVGGPLNLPGQVQPNITQNCVAQLIVKFVSKKQGAVYKRCVLPLPACFTSFC